MAFHKTTKSTVVFDDVPTTQTYMSSVTDREGCIEHGARKGESCYEFQGAENDLWHYGICNSRAKNAGMNGHISASSLVRSPSKKPSNG